MKKKTLMIMMALVMFAVIAVPLYVMAQDMPRGKWWHGQKAGKEFDLSTQEIEKLDQQYLDNRKKIADLKAQVEKESVEFEQMMEADKLDESAITSQFGKLEAARTALSKERFSFIMDSRKILGAERFKKLGMFDEDNRGRMMKNCARDRDR
ncbi:MAG: periplasmic heavy metal sensor, partial [Deltaproteobacteria bacterium]|nr:periplasmic heavy metal sensor [Deltaproteobacteria bacterium]